METMYIPLPYPIRKGWERITLPIDYGIYEDETALPIAVLRYAPSGADGLRHDHTYFYAELRQFGDYYYFINLRKLTVEREAAHMTEIPGMVKVLASASLDAQGLSWVMWLEEHGQAPWLIEAA